VQQERLDAYGFTDVSFIKIDVEGFELEVIDGAAETLRREHPAMLVEIDESQNGVPLDEAIGRIEAFDYDTYYARDDALVPFRAKPGEPAPTNNFIFLPAGQAPR
jgi:hypothetical protein